MKLNPFLLLLEFEKKKAPDPDLLLKIKELLGGNTEPLFACGPVVGILFAAQTGARDLLRQIQGITDQTCRLIVLEIGRDMAQFGYAHHHDWLNRFRWILDHGGKKPWG